MKNIVYLLAAIAFLFANAEANAKEHIKKSWIEKETAEIQEDYNEAIAKIDNSTLSDEQKTLLKAQAQSNKELALSQAQATNTQIMNNQQARKNMFSTSADKKENKKIRKIFKEIDDIL